MKDKIKIGVFGGLRGTYLMYVLLNHPDASVVAICDRNHELLDNAANKAKEFGCNIATFDNFDDFIKYDMDAVVLSNYANEHATFAIRCMKEGKHVISEVLPCETMAQAVQLIETVEETGMLYAYEENYCYMKSTFEMWQRYERGDIGEIMYGEGDYIHDCAAIWPQITYGDRNHWRNRMHPNFYCTHSLGPLITISGLRPVKVVGFECKPSEDLLELGDWRGTGIEMVTLENGAVIKSTHGDLKRDQASENFEIYGKKGMMESGRQATVPTFNLYHETLRRGYGEWERYEPTFNFCSEQAKNITGHGGGDFYPIHFFIQKLLGRPDGKWSIDVYRAVDMGICGILAYRSVLAGNISIDVPDLRDKEQRDKYRNDNACTNRAIAGDQLLPVSSYGEPEIPDEVYEEVRKTWLESDQGAFANNMIKNDYDLPKR